MSGGCRARGQVQGPFRIKYAEPERGSGGKAARSIRILTMATDRLKDTLGRFDEARNRGRGTIPLAQLDAREYRPAARVCCRATHLGWMAKEAGQVRNEAIDLSVQARAGAEHKGLLRIDWTSPPQWALGGIQNEFAVALSVDEVEAAEPAREEQPPAQQYVSFLRR